ncbi:hypothetical protein [Paenibacillus shenyangensis]|uniref:hypothetical protein n=1 Tax=Paenibacillus sp. A9 TaxID=1284352 RepID=UPI000A5F6F93|nr:hypothetical protein [Paenibacillus sp. A9]
MYQPKTNWQKGEVLEASDVNRVEQGLGDIYNRLDKAVTVDLTLAAGTSTIVTSRDVPFNVLNLTGRMLLNLLGRSGNFDNLLGWNLTGGSGTINTTQAAYGTSALLFTLSATSGRITRTVPTTPGSRYLIAAEIRNGTATSANLFVSGGPTGAVVSTNTQYQLSYGLYTAAGSSMDIGIGILGTSGQTVYIDGFRVYELSTADYTAASKMDRTGIAAWYPYTEGLAGVRNPYAIRWTSVAKTEVSALMAFDTELLAPPVVAAESDRDTLSAGADGQYYKNTVWRKRALSGELNWVISASLAGFKEIKIVGYESYSPSTVIPIKFDGTIMQNAVSNKADVASFDGAGNLYLTISSADSGWADGYSPTIDEFKAYMYGWKMYDASTNAADGLGVYSRTDGLNKRWTPLASFNGIDYSGNVSSVPSARPENLITGGYRVSRPVTDYMLMYRRPASGSDPVPTEGAMNLIQGDNVIEVGSGIVLRERVTPFRDNTSWNINNGSPSSSGYEYSTSLTKQRVDRFIAIYKDNRPDKWALYPNTITTAGALAQQSYINYDSNSSYSVMYIPMDRYPVSAVAGNYPMNERAIMDEFSKDIQQLTQRISVTENKKAEKDVPQWITPTTLNSWTVGLGFGYRIEGNRIYFRGLLQSGVTASQTLLFTIPEKFRTPRSLTASLGTYNGSSGQTVAIDFFSDGRVRLAVASALTAISFEGFSYPLN